MLQQNTLTSVAMLQKVATAVLVLLAVAIYRWVRVPAHLRHLPKVPVMPLLVSYLSGEVEERRVKRVIIPFAQKARTDVVLVFCLGEWVVHIVEANVRMSVLSATGRQADVAMS